MNMYKFGNYICKLREEKNLTQIELAKQLDVSDKSVSKWENGQAFPRIETFEKLALALDTTVDDIFSASKDGVKRICVANEFCSLMQIEINGSHHSMEYDESKWIEVDDITDTVIIKITGEIIRDEDFGETDKNSSTLKEKTMFKLFKKVTAEITDLILQADCTYKISNITPDSPVTVELDGFDLGDKTLIFQNFEIFYPKIICDEKMQVELLNAKGKNSKEIIKKYKKIGLWADLGLGFVTMFLSYPLRGLYFRHLCKPNVLKKNIINADFYKQKTEKRNKGKKLGCFTGCLFLIPLILLVAVIGTLIDGILFVDSNQPYLLSPDYSTITYYDDVFVRIDELPEAAAPVEFLGATVWEETRTDGLSNLEQAAEDNMVQLFEDDEGNQYLWLVENYTDSSVFLEDKEYDDFDEHYVYVCEKPE